MKYPKFLLDTKFWGERAVYSDDGFKQKTIEMIRNGYEASHQPDYDCEWEFIKGTEGLYFREIVIGRDVSAIEYGDPDYWNEGFTDQIYAEITITGKASWLPELNYWKIEEISRTGVPEED